MRLSDLSPDEEWGHPPKTAAEIAADELWEREGRRPYKCVICGEDKEMIEGDQDSGGFLSCNHAVCGECNYQASLHDEGGAQHYYIRCPVCEP